MLEEYRIFTVDMNYTLMKLAKMAELLFCIYEQLLETYICEIAATNYIQYTIATL